jgi:pseudouridine-5'-phosphate glycosidase
MEDTLLAIAEEVGAALAAGRPVVALESTLIAHGLPWPVNLETARAAEAAVRAEGAVPATIAVWAGRPTIGLDAGQVEQLARSADPGQPDRLLVHKASRRDLGVMLAGRHHAATTVAGTLFLAHRAGIRLFATGGLGGVHPPEQPGAQAWDVSADLTELARTPAAVVCAGAKSILDLPATLEMLETLAVPVMGYNTGELPAFYLRGSGLPVPYRVDSPLQAAEVLTAHWALDGAGVVLAQPVPAETALEPEAFARYLTQAEELARRAVVRGPARTPFLLARLAELSGGQTLRANRALIEANARLAARIARALAREE